MIVTNVFIDSLATLSPIDKWDSKGVFVFLCCPGNPRLAFQEQNFSKKNHGKSRKSFLLLFGGIEDKHFPRKKLSSKIGIFRKVQKS